MSFIMQKDEQGKLQLVDLYLVKGALDLECPKCHCKNEPVFYWFDDNHNCISRRYLYCCPKCKIHYTNWGSYCDWKSPSLQIRKQCKQNGNHDTERKTFLELAKWWPTVLNG